MEAAILERVRNSSLVEWSGAENDRGSSHVPKPWDVLLWGASVDERRAGAEAGTEVPVERARVRMPAQVA